MSDLRTAAQQALEALEEATSYTSCPTWSPSMTEECEAAAAALRAALAEPEKKYLCSETGELCSACKGRCMAESPDSTKPGHAVAGTDEANLYPLVDTGGYRQEVPPRCLRSG